MRGERTIWDKKLKKLSSKLVMRFIGRTKRNTIKGYEKGLFLLGNV